MRRVPASSDARVRHERLGLGRAAEPREHADLQGQQLGPDDDRLQLRARGGEQLQCGRRFIPVDRRRGRAHRGRRARTHAVHCREGVARGQPLALALRVLRKIVPGVERGVGRGERSDRTPAFARGAPLQLERAKYFLRRRARRLAKHGAHRITFRDGRGLERIHGRLLEILLGEHRVAPCGGGRGPEAERGTKLRDLDGERLGGA